MICQSVALGLQRFHYRLKSYTMTKGDKIILGIFTFLPFLLLCIYFFTIIVLVRDAVLSETVNMPFPVFGDVLGVVITALALGLLSFGLLVYYLIHAINNQEIDTNERLLWVVLFVLASIASFPIYWYMRIWKRNEMLTMAAS